MSEKIEALGLDELDETAAIIFREKLSELYDWAVENGHKPLDFDVERGRIYMEDAEWIDTDVEGLDDE
jgi:hypothetical protein